MNVVQSGALQYQRDWKYIEDAIQKNLQQMA